VDALAASPAACAEMAIKRPIAANAMLRKFIPAPEYNID
jgi:hypothetical protein